MGFNSFVANEGTQQAILTDNTGGTSSSGTVIAVQKVDISPQGTAGTIWNGGVTGTINTGSIVITTGTIASNTIVGGTLQNLVSGTINSATVSGNLGTIGTIGLATVSGNVGISSGTINVSTISTLPNTPGGTINLATIAGNLGTIGTIGLATVAGNIGVSSGTINVSTISTLPNLPQGSINVTAGTIATLGTMGTLGTVSNLGSLTNLGQIYNAGTVQNQLAGTITALQNGTINAGTVAINNSSLTTSGSITANGQSVIGSLNGVAMCGINVGGTFSGTLEFDASIDGTAWFSVNLSPAYYSTSYASTTSGLGQWVAPVGGYQKLRVISTSWSSGTANITLQQSLGGGFTYLTTPTTPTVNVGNFGLGQFGQSDLLNQGITSALSFTEGFVYNGGTAWNRMREAQAANNTLGTGLLGAGILGVDTGGTYHQIITNTGGTIVLPNIPGGSIAITSGTLTAGTVRDNYSAIGTMTITLGTLASSTTGVGRQSNLIDNTSNLYQSAQIGVQITPGTVTGTANIWFYLIRSDNGAPIIDDKAGTADASWTQLNAPLLYVMSIGAGTNIQYQNVFDTGSYRLGPSWGIGVVHNLGNPLNPTAGSHSLTYTGIQSQFK